MIKEFRLLLKTWKKRLTLAKECDKIKVGHRISFSPLSFEPPFCCRASPTRKYRAIYAARCQQANGSSWLRRRSKNVCAVRRVKTAMYCPRVGDCSKQKGKIVYAWNCMHYFSVWRHGNDIMQGQRVAPFSMPNHWLLALYIIILLGEWIWAKTSKVTDGE